MSKAADSLNKIFETKGVEQEDWQLENLNAFEIRRILQNTKDVLGEKEWESCKILDVACGDGIYSVESCLQGSKSVTAIDARGTRMSMGLEAKTELKLENRLEFIIADLRFYLMDCGRFDVIFFLGILYHLDKKDLFPVIDLLYKNANRMVIIDTHVSSDPIQKYVYKDMVYHGHDYIEHKSTDNIETKMGKQLNSVDNLYSFWLSKESLIRALRKAGFSSIMECHVPVIPSKLKDRITLIAFKGDPINIKTFPWVNDFPDFKIEDYKESIKVKKSKTRKFVDFFLNPLGLTLRKI